MKVKDIVKKEDFLLVVLAALINYTRGLGCEGERPGTLEINVELLEGLGPRFLNPSFMLAYIEEENKVIVELLPTSATLYKGKGA